MNRNKLAVFVSTLLLCLSGTQSKAMDHSTDLPIAVYNLEDETVKKLLAKGANPNQPGGLFSCPPLTVVIHLSINHLGDPSKQERRKKIITMLINNDKIKLDLTDRAGKTALHYAVRIGDCETVKKLREKGADPNIEELLETGKAYKNTPLTGAVKAWVKAKASKFKDNAVIKKQISIIRELTLFTNTSKKNYLNALRLANQINSGNNEVASLIMESYNKSQADKVSVKNLLTSSSRDHKKNPTVNLPLNKGYLSKFLQQTTKK